jgi:hypothetical protein
VKISRICLSFAALIGLFAAPVAANADTYEIFDLGSGDFTDAVGITASGTAVLVYNVPVGAPLCATSDICQEYETWVNGVMVSDSPTAPSLVYDNGTPCTASAPFLTFSVPGTCNNGHEVYSAGPAAAAPYTDDTFTGPDPVADLFATGPTFIGDVDLNSSGDFIYNISHPTGGAGEFEEAIDLTTETPEPASVFLLATGLFAVAGTVRRRPFACSN